MSEAPLVSIVLIFYNEERFLPEAVESVLAQTFQSWELLLVDDGSKDGSSELAHAYARQDPTRIRYLEHPGHGNMGMSATRNLGINSARGVYLSFLDADDVWLPGKLEQQVALMRANPRAAMVVGLTEWWYGWTGVVADSSRDFVQHRSRGYAAKRLQETAGTPVGDHADRRLEAGSDPDAAHRSVRRRRAQGLPHRESVRRSRPINRPLS